MKTYRRLVLLGTSLFAIVDRRLVILFPGSSVVVSPGSGYLLESGTDRYLLEDGSGIYLTD